MRRLPCPTVTAKEILDLCIESIQDSSLKNRLQNVTPLIETAEQNYVSKGALGTLHDIAGTSDVGGEVTTAEMKRVYNGTFVKSKRTRNIYDTIKKAPENDTCPLCGQRTVSTLDHYLPQTNHPFLVTTAPNLVPACAECNFIKRAQEAASQEEQTLHPYFDVVEADRWLFAKVIEKRPAALTFSANPPRNWGGLGQRIETHFRVFQLAPLYASHAAVEINDIRFALERILRSGSAQTVREHLAEQARSRAQAQMNSWQRATYEALATSDWFCEGGFLPE
ncbi:hypothetical protein IHE49_17840 [Rhodanobacter sp. 7MK24]|uniref:hypothetical protein n=1 Tax=Rhodanobacter sp. 7MK24 TaxID=2775922 RepID=UPI00177DE743|nr:hypothetical protein [Rhodanobacter sp. 7MK24]MBD8882348.1 hypothetical protein [Rhodanobacter sp. 7MK24]